jgi:tyrosyl-tRNA synthetase
VAVKADVEIGGFDQLFNVKAGRLIQKHYGMAEQDVLVTGMLEGTDGRKMSSSWGNVITITDEPNNMFGKIMTVRDNLITKYFMLCTRLPLKEISVIEKSSDNPRDVKLRLAEEIVALYHGSAAAQSAKKAFIETFSEKKAPTDVKHIFAGDEELLGDVVVREKILPSKAQWRRLITEGAIALLAENSEHKITDPFLPALPGIYKIGKKTFIQIETA